MNRPYDVLRYIDYCLDERRPILIDLARRTVDDRQYRDLLAAQRAIQARLDDLRERRDALALVVAGLQTLTALDHPQPQPTRRMPGATWRDDEQAVLDYLRTSGPATVRQIAEHHTTVLDAQRWRAAVHRLEARGLIERGGRVRTPRGPHPRLYAVA